MSTLSFSSFKLTYNMYSELIVISNPFKGSILLINYYMGSLIFIVLESFIGILSLQIFY